MKRKSNTYCVTKLNVKYELIFKGRTEMSPKSNGGIATITVYLTMNKRKKDQWDKMNNLHILSKSGP